MRQNSISFRKPSQTQCCAFLCPLLTSCGQRSTLHGVSHFLSSRHKRNRIYWFLLVTFGLAMVILHLHMHIKNYVSTPVSTEIDHQTENFTFPDITLCSLNPTTQRMYTRLHEPNRYGHTLEDYIVLGSMYSLRELRLYASNFTVDTQIHRDIIDRQKATYSSFRRSFYPSNELIFSCTYRGQSCMDDFVLLNDPYYWNCYTFRPKFRNITTTNPEEGLVIIAYTATEDIVEFKDKLYTLQSVQNSFFTLANITQFLTAHETGKNYYARILQDAYEPAGLKIAIHDPFTHAHPKSQGFIVSNGQYAKVGLEMYYEHRLDRKTMHCLEQRPEATVRTMILENSTHVYQPYYMEEADCKLHQYQKHMVKQCGCLSHKYPIFLDQMPHEVCYNYTSYLEELLRVNNKPLDEIPKHSIEEYLLYVVMGTKLASTGPGREVADRFRVRMACHNAVYADATHPEKEQEDCLLGCRSAVYKHYLSSAPWPRDFDLYRVLQDVIVPAVTHPNGSFKAIASDFFDIDPRNESNWNSSTELIHRNFARVVIHPMMIKTNVHNEQYTYTFLEVLSEVGGILGLWLGMSILTIFEVVEVMVDICAAICCGFQNLTGGRRRSSTGQGLYNNHLSNSQQMTMAQQRRQLDGGTRHDETNNCCALPVDTEKCLYLSQV